MLSEDGRQIPFISWMRSSWVIWKICMSEVKRKSHENGEEGKEWERARSVFDRVKFIHYFVKEEPTTPSIESNKLC